MGRKAGKFSFKDWESMGDAFIDYKGHTRNESFTRLSESMLQSPRFRTLNKRQRFLYVCCKAQYFGKRKPARDFKDMPEISEDCFYLNWGAVQAYSIYSKTDSAGFYKDMQALEDAGFIKRVASGKGHRTKSIYKFSGDWKKPP